MNNLTTSSPYLTGTVYYNNTCTTCNGSGAYVTNKCGCKCECCKPVAKLCESCNGTGINPYNYYPATYTPYISWTQPIYGTYTSFDDVVSTA